MSRTNDPMKYFLAGGFGGACTVVVGHPFDTIKVRLQTMPTPGPGERPLFSGTWDCALKTVKKEGFRGLYKGMAAPILGVAPIFAISFSGFGWGKKIQQSRQTEELSKLQLFYAGAFSGIFTTIIMAPGERIKCLLQVQQESKGPKLYSGPSDVVRKLYKEGGFRSLFRGSVATLLRDVPASGMYFMSYEWILELLKPDGSKDFKLIHTIFAGGLAGMMNWCVGIPADVLKSRLQTAPHGKYPGGLREVFSLLIKHEGIGALYKGCTPVMLRAFPANAACFVGLEYAFKFLDWVYPNK